MPLSLNDEIRKYELQAAKEREAKQLPIPLEKFASLQNSIRPILDGDVFDQIIAGLASIKYKDKWEAWGFNSANSVLLFTGPSGTGKTTSARWIAKHLRKGIISANMGDFSTGNAGDAERNIQRIFMAGTREEAIIFFDECDALLWSRDKAGPDSLWMLGVINCILTEIEKYNGIVILATNYKQILDPALLRRITFEVEFPIPSFQIRRKLWTAKWPKWPLSLPLNMLDDLAEVELTGAEIEKVIENEARLSISQERNPSIKSIQTLIEGFNRPKTQATQSNKVQQASGGKVSSQRFNGRISSR